MEVVVVNIHPRQSKCQFIQTITSTRRILLGRESSDMGNALIYIYNQTVLLEVSTKHEYKSWPYNDLTNLMWDNKKKHVCMSVLTV